MLKNSFNINKKRLEASFLLDHEANTITLYINDAVSIEYNAGAGNQLHSFYTKLWELEELGYDITFD